MHQPTRYWRLGTTGGDRRHNFWPQMQSSHDIAMGWAHLGDLRQIVDDASRLRKTVVEVRATNTYYRAQTNPERSIDYISDQARQFVRGIKVGDIVVAADGERILGVARVGGEYRFDPSVDPNAPHRRNVDWVNLDDWMAPNPPGKQRPQGFRTTCWPITDPGTINQIRQHLPRELRERLNQAA
jgi:5-methylcytosine-specific restriction protein B